LTGKKLTKTTINSKTEILSLTYQRFVVKTRSSTKNIIKYPTEEIIKENVPLSCGLAGGALVSIGT
jgi:hypothetical protein